MLKQMWPYIGDYLEDYLKHNVQPMVDNSMPNSLKPFRFEKIDLGDIVGLMLCSWVWNCTLAFVSFEAFSLCFSRPELVAWKSTRRMSRGMRSSWIWSCCELRIHYGSLGIIILAFRPDTCIYLCVLGDIHSFVLIFWEKKKKEMLPVFYLSFLSPAAMLEIVSSQLLFVGWMLESRTSLYDKLNTHETFTF